MQEKGAKDLQVQSEMSNTFSLAILLFAEANAEEDEVEGLPHKIHSCSHV